MKTRCKQYMRMYVRIPAAIDKTSSVINGMQVSETIPDALLARSMMPDPNLSMYIT